MSALTVFHIRHAQPHIAPAVRAVLRKAVGRVATGAVHNPVLQVLGAPVHARTAVGHTTPRRRRAHRRSEP
ncbi:hypothetical protein ACMATS_01035 [Streptoverticillium reticulum]|uniref:hypothetical protein n=1 Tax=Streptoverticillium reticulum TaxID=1433415 RepID=UPI0039BF4592